MDGEKERVRRGGRKMEEGEEGQRREGEKEGQKEEGGREEGKERQREVERRDGVGKDERREGREGDKDGPRGKGGAGGRGDPFIGAITKRVPYLLRLRERDSRDSTVYSRERENGCLFYLFHLLRKIIKKIQSDL